MIAYKETSKDSLKILLELIGELIKVIRFEINM